MNLKMTPGLSCAGMASLILVSIFMISGAIIFNNCSKVLYIQKKFLNPVPDLYSNDNKFASSNMRFFINFVVLYFFLVKRLGRIQKRRRCLFARRGTVTALKITIKAAQAAKTSSSSNIMNTVIGN